MTNQEYFDTVTRHLLNQNEQSIGDGGLCSYRGTDGLKCAIGCLIPDDKYDPGLEGRGVLHPAVYSLIGAQPDQTSLLLGLQSTHDGRVPSEWRERLWEIAMVFDLKFNGL